MKYVVLIGDGMADYPLKELKGRTPLEVADTPHMDQVAYRGVSGLLRTVPSDMEPGSDVANLSLMGYDPRQYYTGRGPLEAASIGAELQEGDVAFRCNLITEKNGLLWDFNADHISTSEAAELIKILNKEFYHYGTFYLGTSYRNLFVTNESGADELVSTPPHDIVGEPICENLLKPPQNEHAKLLNDIMIKSHQLLDEHPINQNRRLQGKNPANHIWLWGQGVKPEMESLQEKYGIKAATITGVDLIKGLGVYLGLTNINVPGATAYYDTDYEAKARYAVRALEDHDLVFIHVEAPDEAGHAGDTEEKIRAIEGIDSWILAYLLDQLPSYDDYALALMPDHPTPIEVKTHTKDPVPYTMFSTRGVRDQVEVYNENAAQQGSQGMREGYQFLAHFLEYARGG